MPEVMDIYERLYRRFGPQHWWPGDSGFEVIVGAILTQQASWDNVEKAMGNLKNGELLGPSSIAALDIHRLEELIRPSGFYRQKAVYLQSFCLYLVRSYEADLDKFFAKELAVLRTELLEQRGIGQETADSILLYAGNKPSFVIDAYTMRICQRLGIGVPSGYDELKRYFETQVPRDARLYNEFHALFVKLGKEHCRARNPYCPPCPLSDICEFGSHRLK